MFHSAAECFIFMSQEEQCRSQFRCRHWLTVAACIRFKTLLLFRQESVSAPSYLKTLIQIRNLSLSLCSANEKQLVASAPSIQISDSQFLSHLIFDGGNSAHAAAPLKMFKHMQKQSFLQLQFYLKAERIFSSCTSPICNQNDFPCRDVWTPISDPY